LPTLLALGYAAWQHGQQLWKLRRRLPSPAPVSNELACLLTQVGLLALAASWFAWYATLAMAWPRYLYPAYFIGAVFVGTWLAVATQQLNLKRCITILRTSLWQRKANKQNSMLLLAIVLMLFTAPQAIHITSLSYQLPDEEELVQTATWIHQNTTPDAIIESYDSELLFLLQRRFHYPPDEINLAWIRRVELAEQISFDYNPFVVNPNYIVVGSFGTLSGLYEDILVSGQVELVAQFGAYRIFQTKHFTSP
jgi:hypothetical protein